MKLIMENWKKFINEVFVQGAPEEIYQEIRDWAQNLGMSAEQLGIKQPEYVAPKDVLTDMFNDFKDNASKIEKLGSATVIHFDDLDPASISRYFDLDLESEEPQEVRGRHIDLFHTPGETTKITLKGDLQPPPDADPTTGEVAGFDPAPITPATGMDPSNYSQMGPAGPKEYYEE